MKYTSINFFCCLLLILLSGAQARGQTQLRVTGGSLRVTEDVNIVLTNTALTNNGSLTATAGKVIFRGTSEPSINGTNAVQFHNLTVDKATNNVLLGVNAAVSGELNLLNGLLDLKDFDVDLGTSGTLQTTAQTYVLTSGTGEVVRAVDNGGFFDFIVGKGSRTPLLLENSGSGDVYRVRVDDEVLTGGTTGTPYGGNVVNRTWHVSEEVQGGSDLSLTAEWNGTDELPAFDRFNCYLAQYDGSWVLDDGVAATGTDPFRITRSGLNTASQFTVVSGTALPVTLLSFTGEVAGKTNLLDWVTANEEDFSHFEVERSSDGNAWQFLGEVAGAGQVEGAGEYGYVDDNPPASAYYRLRMVDPDGSFAFSPVVYLEREDQPKLSVFPNPNSGNFTLTLPQATEPLHLAIYTVHGTCVRAQKITQGMQNLTVNESLSQGAYLLIVRAEDGQHWAQRVVVH